MALTRPKELWPAICLLVAAGGMTGLVLVSNRKNVGAIARSIGWTLFGAFFGLCFSTGSGVDPPLMGFCAFLGWTLGGLLNWQLRTASPKSEDGEEA